MLAPVEFNNETILEAGEIDNESINGNLPTEVKSFDSQPSQFYP